MKAVKLAAISGNPEVTPAENPPTIFPKNDPKPYPIFSRIGSPLFKKSSILGKYVVSAPNASIMPPTAPIRVISAPIPTNAAGPNSPTPLNITQAPDNDNSNKLNDAAISRVDPTSHLARSPIMTAKPPTTNVIAAIGPIAFIAEAPALLAILIDTANDIINMLNEDAISKVDPMSRLDSRYKIPASAPTTAVMTKMDPMALPIVPDAFAIRANIPITIDKAALTPINFDPSINDNAAIAPAITPIATVMTIKLPFTSLAPFVAQIIAVITAPSIPTAVTPFANPAKSIKLKATDTAAKTPIATDITKIVPATLAICLSFPIVMILTNALVKIINAPIKATPLIISSADNVPTSLQTPTISIRDVDIANNIPPSFAICCLLPIFVTLTNSLTNTQKAPANIAP